MSQEQEDRIKLIRSKNIEKRQLKLKNFSNKIAKKESKIKEKDLKNNQFSVKYNKQKEERINLQIKGINKKYDFKINQLKNRIKGIHQSAEEKELGELKNSIFVKYYQFRIALIKKRYSKKEEKVKYNLKIAKITEEESNEKINSLRIDEGSVYERWDKMLVKKLNSTLKQRITEQIKKLEKNKENEIKSLEKRMKSTPPSNLLQSLKDIKENVKARSVLGFEIGDVINRISAHVRRYSMFYILAIIIAIFASGTNGDIIKAQSFMTIINGNTYILIIGLAMLLVIVAGYIDLSVGSLIGFMGAMSVITYNQVGNIFLTLLLIIVLGLSIGFVQGVLIGYFKMPAFIVTLGTMLLFQGLILTVTNSKTILPNSDLFGNSSYIDFVTGALPDVTVGEFHVFGFLIVLLLGIVAVSLMLLGRAKKAKYGLKTDSSISFLMKMTFIIALFSILGYYVGSSIFGLQYYLLYIILLIVIFIFITQNTTFGRNIYAIGGNKRAAVLSGINVSRTTTYIFMIVGAMVGFASIIFTAISSNAAPDVSSRGYELDVISSIFVGGASMSGGIGTIPGSVIGALILGYINVGMFQMNFQADMQKIIKAIVLIGAVGYDIYSNRKLG